MKLLLGWLLLMISIKGKNFQLVRVCEKQGLESCQEWKLEMNVTRQESIWEQECFPASTQVLTPDGPKRLDNLTVDDSVLSINPFTASIEYTNIVGWLHHQPHALFTYQQIITMNGHQYLVSHSQNIATRDNQQIQYHFAQSLQQGAPLVSSPPGETVASAVSTVQAEGIFSPLTANFNLFIYAHNSPTIILAHCFSQVHNPTHYQTAAIALHWIGSIIGSSPTSSVKQLLGVVGQDFPPHKIISTQQTIRSQSDDDDEEEREQLESFFIYVIEMSAAITSNP